MSDTRKKLLDAAERKIRSGGYHAVSFRELADDLGIKSSSVHYHFRRKEDLVTAVVERYQENFFAILALNIKSADPLKAFTTTYRAAFTDSDLICLCGMLGAEFGGLPQTVGKAVAVFLQANMDWLIINLPAGGTRKSRTTRARHIVASLQGAMLVAKTLNDIEVFDSVVTELTTSKPASQ